MTNTNTNQLVVNGQTFNVVSETKDGRTLWLDNATTGARAVLAFHDVGGWTLDRKPVRTMTAVSK